MKQIEPIAIFHSPLTSKFGIPRQSGLANELKGRITLEPKYNDPNTLRGLDGFDYLWLIWGFSANKTTSDSFHPTVRPPRLGGNERIGVFASRSPFRPNGLGLSSVKIIGIDGNEIIVSGADLMDGTPIYDIKPYVPYADAHPDARGGFTDSRQWKLLDVTIGTNVRSKITDNEAKELTEILSLDPRPHYQNDPERIYGMPFHGHDVRFKVQGKILTVVDIVDLEK